MAAFSRQRFNDTAPDVLPGADGLATAPGPLGALGAMGNSFMAAVLAGDPSRAFDAGAQGQRGSLPGQARLEKSFGDLGGLDVRQGPAVDAALVGMGALGATRDGQVLLHSQAGPEVAAHEVAHWAQGERFGAAGGGGTDGGRSDAAERDADRAAHAALAGQPAAVSQAPTAGIHRFSLGGALSTGWDVVKSGASGAWDGVKEGASNTWDSAKEGVSNTWSNLSEGVSNTWDSAKQGVSNTWNNLKEGAGDTWDSVKEGAGNTWGSLTQGAGDTWGAGKDWLGSTWGSLSSGDWGGAWSNFTGGAANTWSAGTGALSDTWSSAKDGVSNTWNAGKSWFGNTWGSLKDGVSSTWNAGKSTLGNTWDALKDGAANTWGSLKQIPGKAWDGFLTGAATRLDQEIYKGGDRITDPDPNRLYETAPLSVVANKYTGAIDTPGTVELTSESEKGRNQFTQHFSPLGLPLTAEAWERQNKIDGGKLRKLHDETLLGELQQAGVLDELIKDGTLTDGEIPKDYSSLKPDELSALVNKVDDSASVRDYFANMKPEHWTSFQEGILDNYIAMANKDQEKAAFLLDVLPTELELGAKASELLDQPNDFRAGDDVSAFREGSVAVADHLNGTEGPNGEQDPNGKNVYGLVVPYANVGENIVYNKGTPVDGTEHLHNYLSQIDPSTSTMISGYSQGAAVVMDYAYRYGGSQGLDYASAIAPMGGADRKGGTGRWEGAIYGSDANDTQGVQTISMTHEEDPAQYIHMDQGLPHFLWSLYNFTKGDGQKGDGDLHGGYDNPADGTYGYPMKEARPYIQDLLDGSGVGADGKPTPYQRVDDWRYDMRTGQGP